MLIVWFLNIPFLSDWNFSFSVTFGRSGWEKPDTMASSPTACRIGTRVPLTFRLTALLLVWWTSWFFSLAFVSLHFFLLWGRMEPLIGLLHLLMHADDILMLSTCHNIALEKVKCLMDTFFFWLYQIQFSSDEKNTKSGICSKPYCLFNQNFAK